MNQEMSTLSVAEMKLEIIRAVDRMSEDELASVQTLIDEIMENSSSKPKRKFGALKGGLIYMAPDFDAPLEDFKEYME